MEPMAESLLQISSRDGYIFSSNVLVKVFVSLGSALMLMHGISERWDCALVSLRNYLIFTCRFWWSWVQHLDVKSNNTTKKNVTSMKKVKEKSFITRPAFWCIEINAHTLLYIVLLVIDGKLPIEALNTDLFTSQPCENMFRIARSLSGP